MYIQYIYIYIIYIYIYILWVNLITASTNDLTDRWWLVYGELSPFMARYVSFVNEHNLLRLISMYPEHSWTLVRYWEHYRSPKSIGSHWIQKMLICSAPEMATAQLWRRASCAQEPSDNHLVAWEPTFSSSGLKNGIATHSRFANRSFGSKIVVKNWHHC